MSQAPAANNDDKEIQTHFVTLGLQYMFNRNWGVQAEVPYDFRYFKTRDDAGEIVSRNWSQPGDIRVEGIYTGFMADLAAGVNGTLESGFLALASAHVAMPIANFISFEVINFIEMLCGLGLFATCWLWGVIAMFGMKAEIYVAAEVFRAMKPRASADKDVPRKPLRPIVAIGSTVIRRGVIVFRKGIREQRRSRCQFVPLFAERLP